MTTSLPPVDILYQLPGPADAFPVKVYQRLRFPMGKVSEDMYQTSIDVYQQCIIYASEVYQCVSEVYQRVSEVHQECIRYVSEVNQNCIVSAVPC